MSAPVAIDFESSFEQAFEDGITLLPKIGYFLLILLLGILLAKLVSKALTKVLQKVGFDDAVERGGVKKALARSRYDAAGILGQIVYYFILLLVLSGAFNVFGPNAISDFLQRILNYLPNAFAAVVIIVIAASVAAAVKDLLGNLLGGLSYGGMLATAASALVVAFGLFAALDQLDIAPTVVRTLFVGLVALIVLPLVIAFGVGGIEPAREAIQAARQKAQDSAREAQQELAGAREEQQARAASRTRTARTAAPRKRTAR